MKLSELQENVRHIRTSVELKELISHLKIFASNKRSNKNIIKIIEDCIYIANQIRDIESHVILNGLLILQFMQQVDKLEKSIQILNEMQILAMKINYEEGLAFSHSFAWYIFKIKGMKEEGRKEVVRAKRLIEEVNHPDRFILHLINYTYAIEMWLEERDVKVIEILENCVNYFYEKKLYHSLTMALGVLVIIYQQTQKKDESIKLIKRILSRRDDLLHKMPKETQSVIHFFIGFSHELNFSLYEAENHLSESQNILKSTYKDSIYSGYYVTTLSHLTTTYALQGKKEQALEQIKKVEELLEEGITTKNLDSFSKNQIIHTFNLTKFYIQSRQHIFSLEAIQDLIITIFDDIDTYHSNAIMLSEFLLNANLTKVDLQDIKNLNNPSTRRVEHILDFLISKETHADEGQTLERINTLKRRPVEERMTYVERAFADLLAAQEYYKIGRFLEIHSLLKNYQKQLHFIEVLELRVFMEAFIQVGAFKSGDPLGPALQYMAIKKCRNYGFSRLENKLLDYLDMQHKDIQTSFI